MSEATNYTEDLINNFLGNGTAITGITPYIGLATAVADAEAGSLTEVSGGSYARQASAGAFPASSGGGTLTSNAALTFPTATANWGTVTHFFIADAASSGNILAISALDTAKAVNNGDTAEFASGSLTITSA